MKKISIIIVIIFVLSTSMSFASPVIDLKNESGLNQLRDLILLTSDDYNDTIKVEVENLNYKMEDIVKYISRYMFASEKEVKGLQFIVKNGKEIDVKILFEMSEIESWIVDKYVKDVVAQYISTFQTDEQKIEILHNYVKTIIDYDDTLQCSSTYCAIISHKSICRGYNKLLYKLLKEAGVKSNIVVGYTKDKAGKVTAHEWLEFNLNNQYTYIDVTWNDTSNTNNYYMKSKEYMDKDHVIEYVIRR